LFLEPWLPRDPTLELANVLQRWQPTQERGASSTFGSTGPRSARC
jgi:hypothetical protein